jgi:hypothetical protein
MPVGLDLRSAIECLADARWSFPLFLISAYRQLASKRSKDDIAAKTTPPCDKAGHIDGTYENASEKIFCGATVLLACGLVCCTIGDPLSQSASNDP